MLGIPKKPYAPCDHGVSARVLVLSYAHAYDFLAVFEWGIDQPLYKALHGGRAGYFLFLK
ncbi:hypothetical protein SD51_07790 [Alicyclobacillus tengchongensis]|nr:hypothetical protein SD51_07790 [Alicyclobacillus tengchongensis]